MTKSRAATRPSPSGNAGPSPRPLPHRRRGILLSLVRATTSLVLLLALLVALPAGLLYGTLTMAGSNPLPVHESIPTLLTSPDQGGLFAWALVAVGWIAWGCFALSVLVEIPAQLRGRMPRRLPAMGWSQRTAAGLVGAIFALLPTTGAFAATPTVVTHAPTVATAAPRPDARPAHAAVDGASLGSRVQSSDQVLYKVKDSRPAESLWSIAEAHLGSGTRWKEIARLNEGRTMDAEGRVFHAEGVIQPGWKLLMPADANGLTGPVPTTGGTDAGSGTGTGTGSDFGTGSGTMVHPAMDQAFRAADSVAAPASVDAVTATPTAAPATTAVGTGTGTGAGTGDEVTVRAGDSLSEIATDHRVPGGWPALYEANRAEIGSNPDLIQPGEQLALPAGSSSSPGGSTTTPPVTTPPVTTPPVTTPVTPPAHTAPPAHSTPPASPRPSAGGSVDPFSGGASTSTSTSTSASANASAPASEAAGVPTSHGSGGSDVHATAGAHDSDDDAILLPALGFGGLLAAGLLGVLRRNRILQQRRRPPRRRIPMPTMEDQQYETYLRAMADPSGLDLLDRALRTLAQTCLTQGHELPALAAVALRPGGTIDLYLIEPAEGPAPAPFLASPNGRMWRCVTGQAELLTAAQAADVPAPYPALVTLGRTPDDVQVLADLETVRHLHLDGSPEEIAAVTRAMVAELAASTLADHLRLIVLGSAAPLVGHLGVDRLRTREQPEEALNDLVAHRTSMEQALGDCHIAHPRMARAQGIATDTWVSVLLCTDQVMTQDQLDELGWVLAGREHRCVAAVTPATQGAGWHLDARPGHYRIAGNLPFAVELQRMSEQEFASVLSVLSISQLPPGDGSPDWTSDVGTIGAARAGAEAGGDAYADSAYDVEDPDGLAELDEETAVLAMRAGAVQEEADPFYIPVLAAHAQATAGANPASATAVPLLGEDAPGAPVPLYSPPPMPTPPQPAAPQPFAPPQHSAPQRSAPQHAGPRHSAPQPAQLQPAPTEPARQQPQLPPMPQVTPLPMAPLPSAPQHAAAQSSGGSDPLGQQSPPPPVRRVDPRVMPLTALTQGYDLTAPPPSPTSGPTSAGPRVLLLGQVRVIATNGTADPSRISQLTALAALLTLRPDPDPRDVDAVLAPSPFYVPAPGHASAQGSLRGRASALSKLRDWLGQAPDGSLCLPPAGWRLHPAVTSDWADFQELYRQGMNHRTPAADAALRRALDLVRGRPFDSAYGLYPWAEPYRQDMISAIIDASHELAKRRLAGGDYSGCEAALHSGLAAVPEAEILHRGLMVLYATTGQRDHLAATINLLAQVNASLGCDFSPETVALIGDLTSHPTR